MWERVWLFKDFVKPQSQERPTPFPLAAPRFLQAIKETHPPPPHKKRRIDLNPSSLI
jgi:hypothetical protein